MSIEEISMLKKYICSICKEEFLSIDQVINHLKYTEKVDSEDIDSFFDVIEVETLDSREWTDIKEKRIETPPIKTMPSVPEEYLPKGWIREAVLEYPYKPYYYYPSEQQYYCSDHKFLTKDLNKFLIHILAEHKDYENVLRHAVENVLRHAVVETLKDKVAMDTNKKAIQEAVEKQIQRWLLEAQQTEPEALNRHVEEHFNSLFEYLEGNTTICPYCNSEALISNKVHLDKIFYCLQKGAMEEDSRLRERFEKYKQKYGHYPYIGEEKYLCEWNNEPVLLRLHAVLHLFADHNKTFVNLVKSKILSGELIEFLANKKYLNKETQTPILKAQENKEKLDLNKSPIKIRKQVNLSKGEDALLKWLDKERTKH
jgi:DNA-directed RNA polymerase subunit RPC12/RpoP